MMNKIKKAIIAVAAFFVCFPALTASAAVTSSDACAQMQGDPNYDIVCGHTDPEGSDAATSRIKGALDTVYLIVGIAAIIVIIASGFFYMTSAGEPGKTKRAKDALMYAVIGLIVSILAFAITEFVLRGAGNGV